MAIPLPLSVVIVARNEAHNLPPCLASVQGWVAEIVVALNDTDDDSEAVSGRFGAVVRRVTWQGYRDTKNAALALAREEWVLSLDADESVSPELRHSLEAFFARGDAGRFAGAQFPRRVWFINRWILHGDWYPDLSLRLLHRGRARWGGDTFVHEKVECDGPVATLGGDLLHRPYPTIGAYHGKILEYARLFAEKQVSENRPWSPAAAVFRPAWRFLRSYVLRAGFLDGIPGLIAAVITSYYTFLRYACHYERLRRSDP
ncbi:MAG TPA: glycosyltransferase family 2 protein [Opitutaceae bacterium]|nr:glycosyltransferase family 2 protein [Opitutaceae bacterium]